MLEAIPRMIEASPRIIEASPCMVYTTKQFFTLQSRYLFLCSVVIPHALQAIFYECKFLTLWRRYPLLLSVILGNPNFSFAHYGLRKPNSSAMEKVYPSASRNLRKHHFFDADYCLYQPDSYATAKVSCSV